MPSPLCSDVSILVVCGRMEGETMVVVNVSTAKDSQGRSACHLVVQRDASKAKAHDEGEHALAPTQLDAEGKLRTANSLSSATTESLGLYESFTSK